MPAEPKRAGFPDRLAVDGHRVLFDAAEELLVRLPGAKEDIAVVGAADDGHVLGGGFARASTFEGAGGASEAIGRQGRRIGIEDQDGAWFGLRAEDRRGGKHPLSEVFSGLRHELHAFLRQERFEEKQPVRRGASDPDWTKLQSARLLDRVPHEGGLEGGGPIRRKIKPGLDRAGYRGLRHEQKVGQAGASRSEPRSGSCVL